MDDVWMKDNFSVTGEEYTLSDGRILYKRTKPKILRSVGFNKDIDKELYCREKLMLYIP